MPSNTIPESVVNAACEAAWPEFRSHLEGQQAWSDADPSRQNRLRLIVIQALTAAQKQRQLNVGAPRTPEQIAATVAWVQSLADSGTASQPAQQDSGEAWNRERIEAVASRVERAGDKEAADLIRDLLEAGIEAEQERIDTAPQPAAVDAEVWLFKGTDGEWRTFHNEQHMLDTIADGRWEVRKFYACTPPVVWEEGE